jgi:hypothetical protein
MPEYEFLRLSDGEVVTQVHSMTDAPEIGSIVMIGDEECRRLPPSGLNGQVREYAHTSMSLPRGCKHAKRFDNKGRCVFNSKRELNETLARANADPGINPGGNRPLVWNE